MENCLRTQTSSCLGHIEFKKAQLLQFDSKWHLSTVGITEGAVYKLPLLVRFLFVYCIYGAVPW